MKAKFIGGYIFYSVFIYSYFRNTAFIVHRQKVVCFVHSLLS